MNNPMSWVRARCLNLLILVIPLWSGKVLLAQEKLSLEQRDSLLSLFSLEADLEGMASFGEDWFEGLTEEREATPLNPRPNGYAMLTLNQAFNNEAKHPPAGTGIPFGWRQRTRIAYRRYWEFRFVGDHDPGESLRQGPDHLSSGLIIRPGSRLRTLAVGDHHVTSGMGLVLATSPQLSLMSGGPAQVLKRGAGVKLHPGSDETRFLRGLAAEFAWRSLTLRASLSARTIDARIDSTGFDGGAEPVIQKLQITGLHVSDSEISSRDAAFEELGAVELLHEKQGIVSGLTLVYVGYSHPVHPSGLALPSWAPLGRSFTRAGAHVTRRGGAGLLACEAGWSPGLGCALTAGFRSYDFSGWNLAARMVAVSPAYPLPHTWIQQGSRFTEGSTLVEINLSWLAGGGWEIGAAFRYQRISWLAEAAFSEEMKGMLLASYRMPGPWTLRGVLRFGFDNQDFRQLWQGMSGRLYLESDPLSLFRVKYGMVLTPGGWLADFQIRWSLPLQSFQAGAGLKLFRVAPGTGVIYAYEPDLRYAFSVPALSGEGSRFYLMMRFTMAKHWQLEAKVWRTGYEDAIHRLQTADPTKDFLQRLGCRLQVTFGF